MQARVDAKIAGPKQLEHFLRLVMPCQQNDRRVVLTAMARVNLVGKRARLLLQVVLISGSRLRVGAATCTKLKRRFHSGWLTSKASTARMRRGCPLCSRSARCRHRAECRLEPESPADGRPALRDRRLLVERRRRPLDRDRIGVHRRLATAERQDVVFAVDANSRRSGRPSLGNCCSEIGCGSRGSSCRAAPR